MSWLSRDKDAEEINFSALSSESETVYSSRVDRRGSVFLMKIYLCRPEVKKLLLLVNDVFFFF
jgi:hypothetical protein